MSEPHAAVATKQASTSPPTAASVVKSMIFGLPAVRHSSLARTPTQ